MSMPTTTNSSHRRRRLIFFFFHFVLQQTMNERDIPRRELSNTIRVTVTLHWRPPPSFWPLISEALKLCYSDRI